MARQIAAAKPAPTQAICLARAARPAPMCDADQHHQRLPDREHQRNLQQLQAQADAVAGERGGAVAADEAGDDHRGDHGLQRVQRRDRADAQDLAEQAPLEPPVLALRPQRLERQHDHAPSPSAAMPKVVT